MPLLRRGEGYEVCEDAGIGMLPNKLKITVSNDNGNGDFSHLYYSCTACQFSFSNHSYGFFSRNIAIGKVASNACVATNTKKCPNRDMRPGRFFLSFEAPPQSPQNPGTCSETQPFGLRLRNSVNRFIMIHHLSVIYMSLIQYCFHLGDNLLLIRHIQHIPEILDTPKKHTQRILL